ncbi:MAG: cell wall hydrolase [Alphaproteobacteria bacterium]|nr:cell wall hydrolase [Alphaproteobacteria bacterium]
MTELERHPQALRQGVAAAAVVVITAGGMPAMAMRANDQRAEADATAQAMAFNEYLRSPTQLGAEPSARLTLAVQAADYGWRARASTTLAQSDFSGRAITVATRLRNDKVAKYQTAAYAPAAKSMREQRCLAEAIYYEARGESRRGQMAVAEVVANRVRSSLYPDTFCDVVYQGHTRVTGCQFSFTCDGSLNKRPRGAPWREANVIATEVLTGVVNAQTHRATHYHTTAIDPYWSASLVETTRIGAHVFYRTPTKSERAMRAAQRLERTPEDSIEVIDAPTLASDPVPVSAPVVAAEPVVDLGV